MNVQLEVVSLITDGPDAHRPFFGPRVAAALMLEAEIVEGIPSGWKTTRRVDKEKIDDALTCTARHRGAANVLDPSSWQPPANEVDHAASGLRAPWVPWTERHLYLLVGADYRVSSWSVHWHLPVP